MLNIVIGVILLTFGRRLFWLFVAAVGFLAGFHLARQYVGADPAWVLWAIGVLSGLGGALLALFFQKLAIGLGGFAAGGYIALYLASLLETAPVLWIPLAGGIIGAVLLYILFDWALIFISSIAGASLIVQSISWVPLYEALLYMALIAVGVVLQATWRRVRAVRAKQRVSAFTL